MNLLQFDSEAAWVHAVCSLWRDRLRLEPHMKICLPSGVTPTTIYAEMAHSVAAGVVSFAHATVFALDEFGGLAADDPGKTAATLRRQLIDQIDLPPSAFHALDPDHVDVARHCADYDRSIGDGFDLVLLGIGRNGHLGMNEPGSPLDGTTRRVDLHPDTVRSSARYFTHGDLPRWGLTVGLETILGSKEVWVIANGTGKAEIVCRTVRDEITPSNPASLLRRHPNCSVFVDAAAASMLLAGI
jgi:glucosamine-6-phosphate deaminase